MADLDTEFRMLLVQKEFFARNPSAGTLAVGEDEPLYVAVKFTGDVAALKSAGLQVADIAAGFAFGVTNVAGLEALARLPQVASIQKQRRDHVGLDDSVPELRANQVWSRSGDHFSGYTGKDVIVGIIDTGIDFRHGAFCHADGTTRIHKIWDQTLTAQAGETVPGAISRPSLLETPGTPLPLGYGVEYNAGQINAAIQSGAGIRARHSDDDGHGTHVAGIAAGDGSQSGGCHLAYHYVGVATDATLIVVRKWGLSKNDSKTPPTPRVGANYILDAIRYIIDEARKLNKPVAINLSIWNFSERMDGSASTAVTVDQLLTNNSAGTAIVFIAGNAGNKQFHSAATVPAGPAAILELNVKISASDSDTRSLVILYSGSNLQVQLTSPVSGAGGVIDWISSGQVVAPSFLANGPNGLVTVVNSPNRIDIEIRPPAAPATGPKPANVAGTWKIELKDSGATATAINAFCVDGVNDPKAPYFLNHDTTRTTLSPIGAGRECITVGSYRIGGRLSAFSSRGPTTDSPPRVKPEICAPGEGSTSAGLRKDRTGCKRCCCQCCEDFYVDKDGTSQAAPHITGLVALMLHKNPNLTHTEIKNLLTANFAAKPADSTPEEDVGWGAGRAEAKKTVDAVTQVNPPVAKLAVAPPPMAVLHQTLLETERGPVLDHLFQEHSDEVWELIQKNRRVATVWHRCRGPVWVRFALKAAHAPEAPVPLETDGLRFVEALGRFAQALKRFGSEALRRDVKTWEEEVARVREGMSLREIISAIGNRSTPLV